MFSPYHHFTECKRLETVIESLRSSGNVPDVVYDGFKRYHYALVHKVKCARHYLDLMIELMSNPPPTNVREQSIDFMFRANMYLDGFLSSCGSAMDILAREVLTYFAIPLGDYVYFHTARDELSIHRPRNALINRFNGPSWRAEFSLYRNASTHELIIVKIFNLSLTVEGEAITGSRYELPLPDDPRVNVCTYRNNPDVLKYCKRHLRRLLTLINVVYRDIVQQARVNGRLPL